MKRLSVFVFFVALLFTSSAYASDSLEEWEGDYYFEEFAPPHMTWVYHLSVFNESGEYFAIFAIDGWQTLIRKIGRLTGDSGRVDLLFLENLEDDADLSFRPDFWRTDDVILTLSKKGPAIVTTWGKLEPALEENAPPGVYFEKEDLAGLSDLGIVMTGWVKGNNVRMRAEPNTNAAIITHLNEDEMVTVSLSITHKNAQENFSWFKVEYEGKIGWIYGEFLELPD